MEEDLFLPAHWAEVLELQSSCVVPPLLCDCCNVECDGDKVVSMPLTFCLTFSQSFVHHFNNNDPFLQLMWQLHFLS